MFQNSLIEPSFCGLILARGKNHKTSLCWKKCCKSCVWYTAYVVNKNVVKANFSCLKKVVFEVHQFRVTIALNFVNGLNKNTFLVKAKQKYTSKTC